MYHIKILWHIKDLPRSMDFKRVQDVETNMLKRKDMDFLRNLKASKKAKIDAQTSKKTTLGERLKRHQANTINLNDGEMYCLFIG